MREFESESSSIFLPLADFSAFPLQPPSLTLSSLSVILRVANRNSGTVTSNSPHGDSNQVFVKGQQEVKEGIAQVQGSSSQTQTKY